jgi:hypothetical protein
LTEARVLWLSGEFAFFFDIFKSIIYKVAIISNCPKI